MISRFIHLYLVKIFQEFAHGFAYLILWKKSISCLDIWNTVLFKKKKIIIKK
jgi:hypothetical protein